MDNLAVIVFFVLMLGISMLAGWLLGNRHGYGDSANTWYDGYTDGYNKALDDMEELATRRAKKATPKKATPKKKGK